MIFWHPRCSGAQGVCKILLCLDIVGARGEKTKYGSEKTLKKYTIFLLELLGCHLITKNCTQLAHPRILDAKKVIFFWTCLLFCSNLVFTDVQIYCFFVLTISWNVQTARNFSRTLRASVSLIPQIFRFLFFFCYFFRAVKALWPTLTYFDQTITAHKGVSVSAPNGGGANLEGFEIRGKSETGRKLGA